MNAVLVLAAASAPDRALLERILADPELEGARQPGSALSAIIEAIQTLLGTLLGSEGAMGAAEITRLVFFVLTGIAVVWILRKIFQRLTLPPEQQRLEALSPLRLESPEHHQDLAEAALQQEQYRPALRHFLLSALAALERSRWASYGRHKTNWEYHRAILEREAPAPLCEAFGQLVKTYDPLWYGQAEFNREEVEAIRDLAAAARLAAIANPRSDQTPARSDPEIDRATAGAEGGGI